ncbi:C40 family peptidase [Nonlabens xiamenensis]|uniref:C40 family peptidase n=1 Tax=Nonlabens xiamenensis TaxID=2341043 RepID=UPI0013DE0152|nr:C40 family peptidase [Nonlabens xiamenensis]
MPIRFRQLFGFLSILTVALLLLSSCGSSKPKVITTKKEAGKYQNSIKTSPATTTDRPYRKIEEEPLTTDDNRLGTTSSTAVDMAVEKALEFQGTRYKYGGTTARGMDCSGLICTAYAAAGKQMPRTSASMYATAEELSLEEVRKGDFIFFATGRNKRKVNHVALVTQVTPAEIRFIHSTTSRGVIISSLNEPYWLNAFISAGRID